MSQPQLREYVVHCDVEDDQDRESLLQFEAVCHCQNLVEGSRIVLQLRAQPQLQRNKGEAKRQLKWGPNIHKLGVCTSFSSKCFAACSSFGRLSLIQSSFIDGFRTKKRLVS
jgi:hypothetical protein